MEGKLDTYYIRHAGPDKMGVEDELIDALWESDQIAIHFPESRSGRRGKQDNKSNDPDAYAPGSSAQRAMRLLNQLADEGGYICAEYRHRPGCLIGKVQPKTKIRLRKGCWNSQSEYPGQVAVLKTLQVKAVRRLSAIESALLLVARPQQGTLARWKQIGDHIRCLVEGQPAPIGLSSLLPAQQEAMCLEFLRLPEAEQLGLPRLNYLLAPAGRTMMDLDIIGISKTGHRIMAQVTYLRLETAECRRKLKRLQDYDTDGNAALILFCNFEGRAPRGRVRLISLQTVYDLMNRLGTFGALLRSNPLIP